MSWFFLNLATLLSLSVQVLAENSYVITTPETFRPGMLVNMNVLILKEDIPGTPTDVNATFYINSVPVSSVVGRFNAGKVGTLQLQIPDKGLPEKRSSYSSRKRLLVTGTGGLTFNETSSGISFNEKGFSIYVQTDKGIYKPSQTVHMRVLAVYPDLKVHKGKMNILISDPKNNKLAQWTDESPSSGFVTKTFELSSQPIMGNWKISVEIEGYTKETTFEVKEYVLPKFEVDVTTNSYATMGNGDIRGSVSAKYTYGKGVKGKAKLVAKFPCGHTSCKEFSEVFEIDGSHSFTIKKATVMSLSPYNSNPYQDGWDEVIVNVSVTDELTQKTRHGFTKVRLYRSSIVLKYSDSSPKAFKINFHFQALIEVTRPDGTPVPKTVVEKTKISISTSPAGGSYTMTSTYEDGYIVLKQIITDDLQQYVIKAEAVDEHNEKSSLQQYLYKFKSNSNTFVSVTADLYEVEAGKEIVCKVAATEALSTLNYMILSRGNTLASNSVWLSPKGKSATLKFSATSSMSPSAKIVVYFIRDDGEIVADSITIKINGAFENNVSVKFNTATSEPGDSVNVDVKASPYSHVGLLAVDKSVLLIKEGNDFSVGQVMEELSSYDRTSGVFPPWWRWRRRRSFFFPWYPSAENSKQVFQRAGVAVLTDCTNFTIDFLDTRIMPFEMVSNSDNERELFSYQPQPMLKAVEKVRTFFPETWLWKNIETNSAGTAQVSTTSPDTITSWVLSGFAVSNVTGFGVANEKPQLRVFQPFFVSLDLPYSVIRGEQVAIKVIVFNYESTDMEVHVTLKSSEDWKSIDETETNSVEEPSAGDLTENLKVPANSGASLSFPIIPNKLGNIPITVSGRSSTAADAVKRNLLVEPEGVEQEYSYSLLIDLNSQSSEFSKELELALPDNVVKGSAKASISMIGDIMGSSINGIEKLLRMPYGCGEQNMINFAPSMFIRAYLENVGQLTPSIKEKSLRFMTSGYQRELTYQHDDGSYSAFGQRYGNKRPGSLWLTAFVVKSFARAKSYIYIDPESLEKSIQFILSTQQKDGSFKESGYVSSYLQGGLKSSTPDALTAYVLVSLLESGDNSADVTKVVSKAVQFLKGRLSTMNDVYTLAIATYAMELANDPAKETALTELMKKAIREDGTLHWSPQVTKSKKERWLRPYYRPRSADIETTSYALLVYAHRNETQNGLAIARWLAQQRNSLGGYSSTQDTVIGLQALSEFAPLVYSPDVSFTVDVKLSADPSYKKTFQVDKSNMIVLQQEELPTVDGKVLVSGRGKGIGVLQVGVTYNVKEAPTDESFGLIVEVISAEKNEVKVKSCVTYTGDQSNSGMAIMEIGLPSGFTVDRDEVESKKYKIQRIEIPPRKAVLYFDEVPKSEQICVVIAPVRTHAVGKAQPIPVVVYDYYKPEQRATTMYATQNDVNLCEVCSDCKNCPQKPTGTAVRVISFSHLFTFFLAFLMYNLYQT